MNSDVASNSPESLLQAFAATDYRVRVAGREFVVRPGCRHADLDAALDHRSWAIVTAFNPRGRRIDDADNRARHQRLLENVRGQGCEAHPAVNRDPLGDWPDETAVMIVAAGIDELDAIAAAFDQAAIVTGEPGRPAFLRLYGRDWPARTPDWAERAD